MDGQMEATVSAEKSINTIQSRLTSLDCCLDRFSDSPQAKSSTALFLQNAQPTLADITKEYSPCCLEKQFQDLYRVLHPALTQRANASAFIQGARGSGKSLLLRQVLQAIKDEIQHTQSIPLYRIVHVNGITVPGHAVQTVVREILQQLSDAAFAETRLKKKQKTAPVNADGNEQLADDRVQGLLRLKQTSFTNQLQLLTEILQLACVDGIPVLFVLDELDTFLGSSNNNNKQKSDTQDRQLLLYHLLERVATSGSLVSLVGLTADSAITTRLEKRIKSRAEGTAKFVLTGPCRSFQDLVKVICSQCDGDEQLRQEVSAILEATSDDSLQQRVQETMVRDYRLGKNLRWFSHIMYQALALYQYDLLQKKERASTEAHPFEARYLEEALVDMGGSFAKAKEGKKESDPRLQTLGDLSGPQVALLLAARRILFRDCSSHRNKNEAYQQQQLTLTRMLHEFHSSFKGGSYTDRILRNAFADLMEVGLFRPAADHTGAGPFQYQHRKEFLYNYNSTDVVEKLPLHLSLDIHLEIKQAIDSNVLHCSTALREWGRKAN